MCNNNGGYLLNRIKYLRGVKRSESRESLHCVDEIDDCDDTACEEEDIEILKSTVVSASNLDLIKTKLVSSTRYRLKMLENKSIDLLENFPYFFTNPELVRKLKKIFITFTQNYA